MELEDFELAKKKGETGENFINNIIIARHNFLSPCKQETYSSLKHRMIILLFNIHHHHCEHQGIETIYS